jgi:hypothetical protein
MTSQNVQDCGPKSREHNFEVLQQCNTFAFNLSQRVCISLFECKMIGRPEEKFLHNQVSTRKSKMASKSKLAPKKRNNFIFGTFHVKTPKDVTFFHHPLAPSSPMDIKLEQFLQKSGFANTHISEKVHLGFSSNFAKNYFNIWTITFRF